MRGHVKQILETFPPLYRLCQRAYEAHLAVKKFGAEYQRRRDDRFIRRKPSALSGIKFIQVGSNDGVAGDPIYPHIMKNGWEGILVEPVPYVYSQLCQLHANNSRITALNIAIAPNDRGLTFYSVDRDANMKLGNTLPEWWNQLSSFKRENITKHLDGILEPFIVELNVETLTLDELIWRHSFEDFDLLHIDAEGFDFEVVSTINMARHRPGVILIEHKHMDSQNLLDLRNRLKSNGYKVWELHSDLLAIR